MRSHTAERRAQQLIAGSFFVLAAYVGVESIRDLVDRHHPSASWIGIALAAVTAPTMPLLARAKRNLGQKLNSSATVKEGAQNMLCAYLSIALLIGLLLECRRGLVVGRPGSRAGDRRRRAQGRPRELARRGLLRGLLVRVGIGARTCLEYAQSNRLPHGYGRLYCPG